MPSLTSQGNSILAMTRLKTRSMPLRKYCAASSLPGCYQPSGYDPSGEPESTHGTVTVLLSQQGQFDDLLVLSGLRIERLPEGKQFSIHSSRSPGVCTTGLISLIPCHRESVVPEDVTSWDCRQCFPDHFLSFPAS